MPQRTTRDGTTITWTGTNMCWCTQCEALFRSPTSFDAHLKRGKRGTEVAKHSLKGLIRDENGVWMTKRDTPRGRNPHVTITHE